MVMHITNDLWLNFKLAERAVRPRTWRSAESRGSPVAHYGVVARRETTGRTTRSSFAFMDDSRSLDRAQKLTTRISLARVPRTSIRASVSGRILSPIPIRQIRDREVQACNVLADWLHGGLAGTDKDPRCCHHPRQGRVRRALRNTCSMRCATAASDRARSPHYGMPWPVQSRQEPARTMQDIANDL